MLDGRKFLLIGLSQRFFLFVDNRNNNLIKTSMAFLKLTISVKLNLKTNKASNEGI